jgi:hypothetical protein
MHWAPAPYVPAGANFLFCFIHECAMTAKRNRTKQTQSLQERLQLSAKRARELARRMSPGKDRDILLRRAEQSEVTSNLTDWLSAPGFQKRGG